MKAKRELIEPLHHWGVETRYAGPWVVVLLGLVLGSFALWVWVPASNPVLRGIDGVAVVLGLITLLLVWYFEQRRRWMGSLPLRMDVRFWIPTGSDRWELWEGAQGVFLVHEGDIRNMAQQVGSQIATKRGLWHLLPLDPYMEIRNWDPRPAFNTLEDEWQRLYEVDVALFDDPECYPRSLDGKRVEGGPSGGLVDSPLDDRGMWTINSEKVRGFRKRTRDLGS